MTPYGSGVPLVFDTSAWNRQGDSAVRGRWLATLDAGLLVACPVVALELLGGARDESEFAALDRGFSELRQAPVTAAVCAAAISASRALGRSRRLPAAEYLIAAAAAERGFGVLHEDHHFEILSGVLGFVSVRVTV